MRKPRPSYLATGQLEQNRYSQPSSAFEDSILFIDVHDAWLNTSPYGSTASSPRSAMGTRPPTLSEILLNTSSPPWTLSAFMAYLSQNHCMETLEFTLDLQRYSAIYEQMQAHNMPLENNEQLCSLWDKLVQVYVAPASPREVNIPAVVRDRLLRIQSRPMPPPPSELDEAGQIVYDLMNDSLLVPFLESVSPMQLDSPPNRSPKLAQAHHLHLGGFGRRADSPRSASSPGFEDGLTDDSDGNSPPPMEPMTPPTTPPTSSDWGYTSSGGLQRAMAAHSKSWKKMGAKLGFKGRSSSRRSSPSSSSAPGSDPGESSHHNDSL
jgi:hypothetical protein